MQLSEQLRSFGGWSRHSGVGASTSPGKKLRQPPSEQKPVAVAGRFEKKDRERRVVLQDQSAGSEAVGAIMIQNRQTGPWVWRRASLGKTERRKQAMKPQWQNGRRNARLGNRRREVQRGDGEGEGLGPCWNLKSEASVRGAEACRWRHPAKPLTQKGLQAKERCPPRGDGGRGRSHDVWPDSRRKRAQSSHAGPWMVEARDDRALLCSPTDGLCLRIKARRNGQSSAWTWPRPLNNYAAILHAR